MKNLLLFLSLFSSCSLLAQKKSIWLGVQAGFAIQSSYLANPNNTTLGTSATECPDLGINLEYRFSKQLGVEAGIRYTELYTDVTITSQDKTYSYKYTPRFSHTVSFPTNLVGRLHLSSNRAFLIGKVGLAFFQRDVSDVNSITSFGNGAPTSTPNVAGTSYETRSINEKGFLLGASIGLEGRFFRKGNIRLMLSHSFSPVNVMQWSYACVINNEPVRYETIYSRLRNTGISVHVSFPMLRFGKEKKLW